MNKREEINRVVKESIIDALFEIMKKKDFSDVTISEITKKAGVSRVSFYRNFTSKEDIIKKYLKNSLNNWKERWENSTDSDIIFQVFKFFNEQKDMIDLLYKSHLQWLLAEELLYASWYDKSDINIIAYTKSMFAYGLFGICNEWYLRGMKETPEKITQLFKEMQEKQNN